MAGTQTNAASVKLTEQFSRSSVFVHDTNRFATREPMVAKLSTFLKGVVGETLSQSVRIHSRLKQSDTADINAIGRGSTCLVDVLLGNVTG